MTVSKSTPAAIAILAGPRPVRAGTASRTRLVHRAKQVAGRARARAAAQAVARPRRTHSNSITSRAPVTQIAPHSLMASWQPADCAET